ncbi:hypothetical protein N657DRAFT_657396 [Parathielavia appendiculata]|uniref:Uncharacterized protein n=1 Tax=Parathielavia appendiculata TaxID=2587402 RepID=A0AAN6TWE4_9PEZI|nr:hypothetical protein N657DRAFT_657396 [Parathielavia appendiculata]
MSDEELDREWKPNGRRPQSAIAQMFSQELMDIFRIDNSVNDLDEKVKQRKQQINSQTSELEALEARIREMEMRLKGQIGPDNPGQSSTAGAAQSNNTSAPAPPEKDYPADQSRAREQQHKYAGSRPGTAKQSQPTVPGALPPTPAGSEGESKPSVTLPFRPAPRPPGTQAELRSSTSHPSRTQPKTAPGGDSDSVKSMSESVSVADYVIVPAPDGDRERDA